MRLATSILTVAVACGCAGQTLTDARLLKYASSSYDKTEMEGRHLVLGVHNGTRVLVDFPCGDLCPTYTVRVIHYDLPTRPECLAHGGVVKELGIWLGPGAMDTPFCFPKVIADNWAAYRR